MRRIGSEVQSKFEASGIELRYTRSMDIDLDLATASREALVAVIAEQKATIAELQRRLAALEARLNTRGTPGMPGNKPPSSRSAPRKAARKRRPHGFARQRMAPTEWVEHALEACPDCGTHLVGGWAHRSREVIEIPVVQVQVQVALLHSN